MHGADRWLRSIQWTTYDEYGNSTQPGSAAVWNTYKWHGAEQRAVVAAGLILMGARLYNPVTGHFLSRDGIPGGNDTPYSFPLDPVNIQDIGGLSMAFGGVHTIYMGGGKAYVGHTVNFAQRLGVHLRVIVSGAKSVAFYGMARKRGESYGSYNWRLRIKEQRVMNTLDKRGYELQNAINAIRSGDKFGYTGLKGFRNKPARAIRDKIRGGGPAVPGGGAGGAVGRWGFSRGGGTPRPAK